MEEAANRIGTKLKEFSRQGNEQVEKVEMADIMLELRTKNDAKYCGEDHDRRQKIIGAFRDVVVDYQMQELRATKYQSVAKDGMSGLAEEEVESDIETDLFFLGEEAFADNEEDMKEEAIDLSKRAVRTWAKLKSNQPAFWKEHMPQLFDEDGDSYILYTDDKGEKKIDALKMIQIDMLPLYMKLSTHDIYGVVAKVAMSVLGRNLSESFVERLFSATQLVLTEKASNMGREIMQMRTLLRMNKGFMEMAKQHYPDLLVKEVKLQSEAGKRKQEEIIIDVDHEDRKKRST